MSESKKDCEPKDCGTACKHRVDTKSLEHSKDEKKKIFEGNKIVKK